MINFYKINEQGYPEVGSGKTLPQGYTEFEVATDEVTGISLYYPEELNDAMTLLQQQDDKAKQIAEAKQYLEETDYKVLPDYDGDTTGIFEARAEARALIRQLEGGN